MINHYYADVQIKNLEGIALYKTTFNNQKAYAQFIQDYGQSKERWPEYKFTFIPARTDTLRNFAKDLFLPRIFNIALKTNDLAVKILIRFIHLVEDLITFPVRLILSPFRLAYTYEYPEKKHPLSKLVKNLPDEVLWSQYEEIPISANSWRIELKTTNIAVKTIPDSKYRFSDYERFDAASPAQRQLAQLKR